MAAILPATTKRTNKSRFCRAQAFTRNDNAAYRLIASSFHVEKQEKEKNVPDPQVCSVFFTSRLSSCGIHYPGWGFGWGLLSPLISNCINEKVSGLGSLLYTCCSNSECVETNICQTNKTVAPEPCEGDQSLMYTRNLLLNSHFSVYRNQTKEHLKNRNL